MAILKKSRKSTEPTQISSLLSESQNLEDSSEINTSNSINKLQPKTALLRGINSGNIVTIDRLKDILVEQSLPVQSDLVATSGSEVNYLQNSQVAPATKIDYKEIDKQIQLYRKQAELEFQNELASKRTEFMAHMAQEKAQNLDQGYQDGFNQGEQEGRTILENQAQEFLKAMNYLTLEKKDVFIEAKPDILRLSIKIAEKIIQKTLSDQPELFEIIIDEAIAKVTDKDKVIIRVNPEQVDTVRKYKDRLLERINDIKSLEIQDDPKIERGGCMIETKLGYVDATLPIKLSTLQNALFKTMEDEDAESNRT